MSIEASSLVWKKSKQTGTPRLVMLSVADNANADGYAWPGFGLIASMCNCSERQVSRIIADLEASGELYVERGVGRKNYTRYLITLDVTADQLSRRMVQYLDYSPADAVAAAAAHVAKKDDISGEKATSVSPFEPEKKVTSTARKDDISGGKGDIFGGKGDIAMSPDPMIQHDPPIRSAPRAPEPTQPAAPAKAAAAAAPSDYQAVVRAYQNEIGLITPIIQDGIKAQLALCPVEWLTTAISIAARRNNRRWAYVEGILRRWHTEGFDGGMDNLSARAGAAKSGSKSTGYGRQMAPAVSTKGQSIEDYADDPEYYAQLMAIRAGGNASQIAAD